MKRVTRKSLLEALKIRLEELEAEPRYSPEQESADNVRRAEVFDLAGFFGLERELRRHLGNLRKQSSA